MMTSRMYSWSPSRALEMILNGSTDQIPSTLSAHALAALAEFNAEKDERAKRFEKLKAAAEADGPLSMDAFTEDWNESQFWVRSGRAPHS